MQLLSNFSTLYYIYRFYKLLEKVIFKQLIHFLEINNLIDPFQSAYRPNHSTETCLNHVISNIINSFDTESSFQLLLLDL